jgi:hypothetical protein
MLEHDEILNRHSGNVVRLPHMPRENRMRSISYQHLEYPYYEDKTRLGLTSRGSRPAQHVFFGSSSSCTVVPSVNCLDSAALFAQRWKSIINFDQHSGT